MMSSSSFGAGCGGGADFFFLIGFSAETQGMSIPSNM
jgi:hypothetical protein